MADKSTAVNPDTVKVGDLVTPQNYSNMELPITLKKIGPGPHVVTDVQPRVTSPGVTLTIEGLPSYLHYGYEWFAPATKPIESPTPAKLRAALTYKTSREYAIRAMSRSLDPDHNAVLQAAGAEDKEVDVVAFRKAATAALSLASTRTSSSSARREYAKEARHLIHWADAIIDNHIAGLPAYESGERSRKVKALDQEVAKLRDLIRRSNEDVKVLAQERDALKAGVDKATKEIRALVADLDELQAAYDYAFAKLSDGDQHRVAGFRDGWESRGNE